jgi:hypothetical protein
MSTQIKKNVNYQFEDFLADVEQSQKAVIMNIHESLTGSGYRSKVEKKASGFFVGYTHPATKRSMLNLLFRKKGLHVRIYAENHKQYAHFIHNLPEDIETQVAKATDCKRFLTPPECSDSCSAGYDILIGGNRYQKCRYACFHLKANTESLPVITELIEFEKTERNR